MNMAKIALAAAVAVGAASAANAGDRQDEANAAFTQYPKGALENGEHGTVYYHVKIDRQGRARECEVTQSSGYQRLDTATCDLLMSRARFTPSRDSRGRSTRSTYDGRVIWRIS